MSGERSSSDGRGGKRARAVDPAALAVTVDRSSPEAVYRQIERQVRERIAAGAVDAGARLPPERTLAAALGVDRTTVVAAYRALAAANVVSARVGQGTTVNPADVRDDRGLADRPLTVSISWHDRFAPRPEEDPVLDDIASVAGRPGVISLVSGVPDPATYPIAAFRELLDEALGDRGQGFLQYSPPEGLESLRVALASRSAARGIPATPARTLVCAGSQQGLYLLARAFVEPGDVVAVEAPTYLGALQVFRSFGARLLAVPSDRDGLDPDRLNDLLGRRRVKLLYLLPTYQNPTGRSLGGERRRRLVEVARRHGLPVIEDDPYGELRYEREVHEPLAAIVGPDGLVISLSTFSKMLFPGFRLGWITASEHVIQRLAWEKSLVDLDSNSLAQWAMSAYMGRGLLDAHLDRVRAIYPPKRDALAAALSRSAGPLATWHLPRGGFYLWVQLANGLRAREVLAEAARSGVTFVPGDLFHADGGGGSTLRLAFSAHDPVALAEAGTRLGGAITRVAERSGRRTARASRIV